MVFLKNWLQVFGRNFAKTIPVRKDSRWGNIFPVMSPLQALGRPGWGWQPCHPANMRGPLASSNILQDVVFNHTAVAIRSDKSNMLRGQWQEAMSRSLWNKSRMRLTEQVAGTETDVVCLFEVSP
jgi:hypothetical protein